MVILAIRWNSKFKLLMKIYYALLIVFLLFIQCQKDTEQKDAVPENEPQEEVVTEEKIEEIRSKHDQDNLNFIQGKFNPAEHENFVLIEKPYTDKSDMYLQKEAYESFKEMHASALKAGHELKIISATRNFDRQKEIWENKWTGKTLVNGKENMAEMFEDGAVRAIAILEWSSMPGTSRHHWGTDIDINALDNSYFETGKGKALFDWLKKNASEFGFCQPYTEKGPDRPWGYNEERWHWSYQPLARIYMSEANVSLLNEEFEGFLGAETAQEILVKEKYVLGVNPECR